MLRVSVFAARVGKWRAAKSAGGAAVEVNGEAERRRRDSRGSMNMRGLRCVKGNYRSVAERCQRNSGLGALPVTTKARRHAKKELTTESTETTEELKNSRRK